MKNLKIATLATILMAASSAANAGKLGFNPIPYDTAFPVISSAMQAGHLSKATVGGWTVPPAQTVGHDDSPKVDVLQERRGIKLIVNGVGIKFHRIFWRTKSQDFVLTRVRIGAPEILDVYLTTGQVSVKNNVVFSDDVVWMPHYVISADGTRGNNQGSR